MTDMTETEAQVLNHVNGNTAPAIAEASGLGETTVRKALKELITKGFVTAGTAEGVKGAVFTATDDEGVYENDLTEQLEASIADQPDAFPGEDDATSEDEAPTEVDITHRTRAADRDAWCLEILSRGVATMEEVAEEMGISKKLAYQSFWRLSHQVLRGEGEQELIRKVRTGDRTPVWGSLELANELENQLARQAEERAQAAAEAKAQEADSKETVAA